MWNRPVAAQIDQTLSAFKCTVKHALVLVVVVVSFVAEVDATIAGAPGAHCIRVG
jgi:hypothetical protein